MIHASEQLQGNLVDFLKQAATSRALPLADLGPEDDAAARYQTIMALSREMSEILERMWARLARPAP